jgi:uncharacterized protein with GYD domain
MTKLSTETMSDSRGLKALGHDWLEKVSRHCPNVKWLAHYALLGRYDFMDIYEAPDFETAHKVSYISRAEGASEAESWQAVSWDDYVGFVDKLD